MLPLIELIKELSWPVVILGVATLYRVELKESFGRLISIKYRNFELNFGADLQAAKALVAATSDPSPTPPASPAVLKELDLGTPSPGPRDESARLGRLAEVSPRATIAEAWHEVEAAAVEATRSLGLPDDGRGLEGLTARGILPASTLALGNSLRALQDRVAAEGPILDAYLTPRLALDFAGLARSLAAKLRAFARSA